MRTLATRALLASWCLAAGCGGRIAGGDAPFDAGGHADAATTLDCAPNDTFASDSFVGDTLVGEDAPVEPDVSTAGGEVLASDQQLPWGIAVDATYVYWTNRAASGAVMRMPKGGGTPSALVPSLSYPSSIAVDDAEVYWGNVDVLSRAPIGGGAVTDLDSDGAFSIALDSTRIFVSTNVWSGIASVSKDGGGSAFLERDLDVVGAIAVDGASVYWTSGGAMGGVYSIPTAGGSMNILASGQNTPNGIAVDATNVYWVTADGNVCSVPIAGGAVKILASGRGNLLGLARDGSTLYWTSYVEGGSVEKMSVTGGAVTTLATGQHEPAMIVVDESATYWTAWSGGSVMRGPK